MMEIYNTLIILFIDHKLLIIKLNYVKLYDYVKS